MKGMSREAIESCTAALSKSPAQRLYRGTDGLTLLHRGFIEESCTEAL
jgi:hypothetical protein